MNGPDQRLAVRNSPRPRDMTVVILAGLIVESDKERCLIANRPVQLKGYAAENVAHPRTPMGLLLWLRTVLKPQELHEAL